MKQILNLEKQNYDIVITDDNFIEFINEILAFIRGQKILLITTKTVYKLYKNELKKFDHNILVLKDGEKEKNYRNYLKILKKAGEIGLTRKDALIAFGGGVIGDIVGFVASTYMRGIDYIQVPTTLLSMVDSSVGGKTAIDFCGIKNLIGTFYHPKKVFININFLQTLDKRQYLSGIGEVLKYALIEENCKYDYPLFLYEYLSLCSEKLLCKDSMTLMRVIEYCLKLKIAVVNEDEKELNLRKILNLGHTIGHAIEALGKYKKTLHGEAIIQGIFYVLSYAYKKKLITYSYYRLSVELFSKYGFKIFINKYDLKKIIEFIKRDKKAIQDRFIFIIPTGKKVVTEMQFTENEVLEILDL